jgi:hypothetical protein
VEAGMTDHAYRRRSAPPSHLRVTTPIRATDTLQMRAEAIVHMLGMTGDPAIIATHIATVRDMLTAYALVDGEARQ